MGSHIQKYIWMCIMFFPLVAMAQVVETRQHVDTLSTAERLSLRTNAVDWLLLVPNIGVEFDVGQYNWNRWSAGLNVRFRPGSNHTFKPGIVYNVTEVRAEVRNYYRIRPFDGRNVRRQKHFWDRLVSARRPESRHPNTVYYRGAFVGYNTYSLKLGKEGKQGNAILGGVMWGMVKPLYEFASGNSLDLEFAAAVGVAYAKYDTYTHNREDDCYPKTGNKTTIMPIINDLRVGFVYRFGKYPISKKYRWRYDVDRRYQDVVDSVISARQKSRNDKLFMDSLDGLARKMFWSKYDSLATKNKAKNDSIRLKDAAQKAKQKKDEQAAKEAEKQAKKAAKEEEKKQKKEALKPEEQPQVTTEPKVQEQSSVTATENNVKGKEGGL